MLHTVLTIAGKDTIRAAMATKTAIPLLALANRTSRVVKSITGVLTAQNCRICSLIACMIL